MTPASPRVSIVLVGHNQGEWLPLALRSFRAQTLQDFEVIAVDSGSSDGSRSSIARASEEPWPHRYVHMGTPDNIGLSRGRNLGAREACGEYLLFVDADDELAPTFLEKTVAALERDRHASFAFTDVELLGAYRGYLTKRSFTLPELLHSNRIVVTTLMKRSLYVELDGFDIDNFGYCEDWDFWIRALKAGHHGVHVAEPLFRYRRRFGSLVDYTGRMEQPIRAYLTVKHAELHREPVVESARRLLARLPDGWLRWPPMSASSEFGAVYERHRGNCFVGLGYLRALLTEGDCATSQRVLDEMNDLGGSETRTRLQAEIDATRATRDAGSRGAGAAIVDSLPAAWIESLTSEERSHLSGNLDQLPPGDRVDAAVRLRSPQLRRVTARTRGAAGASAGIELESRDGGWVRLTSVRPEAEARSWLATLQGPCPRHLVVVGLGLGYLLDVLESDGVDVRVLAIEPEPATVPWLLARRDLSRWLDEDRLVLTWRQPYPTIEDVLARWGVSGRPATLVNPALQRHRGGAVVWIRAALERAVASAHDLRSPKTADAAA
jgi:hypothetical protein